MSMRDAASGWAVGVAFTARRVWEQPGGEPAEPGDRDGRHAVRPPTRHAPRE
ncbi:hypothetical protein ACWGKW_12175 [Streptomyces sp. NPDC054766]